MANALRSLGWQVTTSDRAEGFLNERAGGFDWVVSNPPYSLKNAFLARCYDLGKQFAPLMPITTFDSQERRRLFHEFGVQGDFSIG
jgi:tRNA1(Val) A37 N6-methylase TrmN6